MKRPNPQRNVLRKGHEVPIEFYDSDERVHDEFQNWRSRNTRGFFINVGICAGTRPIISRRVTSDER